MILKVFMINCDPCECGPAGIVEMVKGDAVAM